MMSRGNCGLFRSIGCTNGLALIFVLLTSLPLYSVDINTTVSPAGPIQVGDMFTVDFSVANWNPSDGPVDAFAIDIGYDATILEFVDGVIDSSTDAFLAQPNQQSSYVPLDISFLGFPGLFRLEAIDDDIDSFLGGSEASSGRLGRLQMRAIAQGTGSVTPSAPFGDPIFIFSDVLGSTIDPTGGASLQGASMTVVPEPQGIEILMFTVLFSFVITVRIRADQLANAISRS